jgi:hypothetical protein
VVLRAWGDSWHLVDVTREQLVVLLATARGEAIASCSAALADPSVEIHDDADSHGRMPTTEHLLMIYRRRAKHVRTIQLPVVGMEEAVRALSGTSHAHLRLLVLEVGDRYPWCVIFLSPAGDEVVAAVAVTGPPPNAG